LAFPPAGQDDFFSIFPKLPSVARLELGPSFVFIPYISRRSREIAIFSVLHPMGDYISLLRHLLIAENWSATTDIDLE